MILKTGLKKLKSSRTLELFYWYLLAVLKDYLIKGYAVNEKRLKYLEKTIKLIDIAGRIDYSLKSEEAMGIFCI